MRLNQTEILGFAFRFFLDFSKQAIQLEKKGGKTKTNFLKTHCFF